MLNFKIGEKVLVEAVVISTIEDEDGELCEVKILGSADDDLTSYIFIKDIENIHKLEG